MKIFQSIYFKITILLISVTIFTGALTGFLNYMESRNVLEKQIEKSLKDNSSTIVSTFTERLNQVENVMNAITSNQYIKSSDFTGIQSYLNDVVSLSTFFHNIYYFDAGGNLKALQYADKRPITKYMGQNYNDYKKGAASDNYKAIKKAIETKQAVYSKPFFSSSGKLIFTYIAPLFRDGKNTGVVSCGIYGNDSNIQQIMNSLRPPENGFVISYSPDKGIFAQSGHIPEYIKTSLNNYKSGSFIHDRSYKIYVSNEPKTGIFIGTAIDANYSDELLRDLELKIFIYAFIAVIIVIIAGMLFANSLIIAIAELINGLKKIGEGIYSHRIEIQTNGELKDAVNSFNEMAEKLHKPELIEKIWLENWHE